MDESTSFLGKGWGFPPTFSKELHSVLTVEADKEIEESLHVLFSTALGERIMYPDYGCDLRPSLFEITDNSLINYLKDIISVAVLHYEPRIILLEIDIDTNSIMDGYVFISLDYTIRTTNSRNNVVYPFYLNEGNLVQK